MTYVRIHSHKHGLSSNFRQKNRQLLYSHLSLEKCHFFYSNCHDFITRINENCIDFITKYRKLS